MAPRIEAWPEGEAPAPTNARVFVRFPGGNQEKVIVRLAGTKDTDGIPSSREDVVSGDVRFVELVPRVKLAAGATFEVVVGSGKNQQVVSSFEVGAKADAKMPGAPEIAKATFIYERAVCCNCSSGQPHVEIELAGKQGEETRRLYGIWSAGADGKVDWKRKPDAYVRSWYGRLSLGNASTCSANNFAIPKKKGKMSLGLREISQAGKQSEGKTLSVTVTGKKIAKPFVPPSKNR